MHVTVIDYKAGNLTSVLKTLKHLGAEPVVTDGDLSLVESAERIVLPGVGHFAATERLDETGLTGAIRPGSGHFQNPARGLPKAQKKFRTSAGIRSKCARDRDCSPVSSRANLCTSRIPTKDRLRRIRPQ
jgi:hypothetical protein